jgi:hypothetical protein
MLMFTPMLTLMLALLTLMPALLTLMLTLMGVLVLVLVGCTQKSLATRCQPRAAPMLLSLAGNATGTLDHVGLCAPVLKVIST